MEMTESVDCTEGGEQIFYFHHDRGPFAYNYCFNYSICYENNSYLCEWGVGWDGDASTHCIVTEKAVAKFLKRLRKSIVSKWNGFNESMEEVQDGYTVSLYAVSKKIAIDIKMRGYHRAPFDFLEGSNVIHKEYFAMLGKAGKAHEMVDLLRIREARSKKEEAQYPYLICVSNDAKSIISEPMFKIGRNINGFSGLDIRDNHKISREHARIIMRSGNYYIIDLDSTNKTSIDGAEIPPGKEIVLYNGAKICFANEEFVFYYGGDDILQ